VTTSFSTPTVGKDSPVEFEIPRKKLVKALINSKIKQLEKSKVVSKPLLAEETELEDAKALRKAVDDMVAEIHEQEGRSEARTAASKGSTAPLSTETLSTLKPSLETRVTTSFSTPTIGKDSPPQSRKSITSTTVESSPVLSATSKKPTLVKSSQNDFKTFQAVPSSPGTPGGQKMESSRDDVKQSSDKKGITMISEKKDKLKDGPILAVDVLMPNRQPSSTSSSNSLHTDGLPSMTKTSPTATLSLPNTESTVATQRPFTQDIVSSEQRIGKVLLPDDLSSIIGEGEHLHKPLFQKLASEAAISPARLLKMVEKVKRKEHDLELRKGVPKNSLKQRPSAAELLNENTQKVVKFVTDHHLTRQGKNRSLTDNQLKEAKGKPTKLGEESEMGIGSKTKGDRRLEMFRIAGDSSNTVIFLDLSSADGKRLEHATLTLGGGRTLVKLAPRITPALEDAKPTAVPLKELLRPKYFSFSPKEAQYPSFASFKKPEGPLVKDFASTGKNRPEGKVLLPEDLHFIRQLLHEMFSARAAVSSPSSLLKQQQRSR